MLHLLGIRHHGPGSCLSMLRALETIRPDCLLVEAPADAQEMIKHIAPLASLQSSVRSIQSKEPNIDCGLSTDELGTNELLTPPVALLIYNPKDITQASYFPFAEFSPEWQAVKFALQNNIPVRCMDLPMSVNFVLDEAEKNNPQAAFEFLEKLTSEERQFRQDPMAHLAKLAGYTDSERWWEVTFESAENEAEIFTIIFEMMAALREMAGREGDRNLRREAYMRQCIRQAEKDGFQNIAVVCGAWHVPALHDYKRIKAGNDASLLKGNTPFKGGRRGVTTTATWIPWSYDRLTFQSGYGAGVISPAWYELLFSNRKEAVTRWMINVARLFREEDLDTSSAHVIEAIRLSETLATLRGLALPGMEELKEAAVTTICEGDVEKLELIESKLITGDAVGSVPDYLKIPAVPLLKDIEQEVKSARLTKYWENTNEEWLGATAANPRGGIDLREEAGRQKSHLLHRLNLLDIPWGKRIELDRHQSAGGFKEFWKLKWSPEFAIRIIEMGAWGNTLEAACIRFLKKKSEETETLPALTNLVGQTLDAHLPDALDALLRKLENLAALTTDVFDLMSALPPLARVVRYGDTRGTDVSAVGQVVRHIVPRICIGLPGAVSHLDEEASHDAFNRLLSVHRSLGLLNLPEFNEEWNGTLKIIADSTTTNGILTGACTRLLFDKKVFSSVDTATRMRYALSRSVPPFAAAQWLEGFLQGSGLLLLHNQTLWNLLDGWVNALGAETFNEVLPLVRRTFSRFPQPERERMMDLAKQGQLEAVSSVSGDFDMERAGIVLPVVRRLLGMD